LAEVEYVEGLKNPNDEVRERIHHFTFELAACQLLNELQQTHFRHRLA
jgi:hypothetical protein